MNKNIFNFKNKTAVITGGAQGFGLDIAKRFLDSGAKVIIWDIDTNMIEKAKKDLNSPNLTSNIIDVANSNDLWFHIEGESSCHVIASMPIDMKLDKKQLRQIVTQGAVLCKSKSRFRSNKNVPVIYTKVENITKSEPVGTVITENTKSIII